MYALIMDTKPTTIFISSLHSKEAFSRAIFQNSEYKYLNSSVFRTIHLRDIFTPLFLDDTKSSQRRIFIHLHYKTKLDRHDIIYINVPHLHYHCL